MSVPLSAVLAVDSYGKADNHELHFFVVGKGFTPDNHDGFVTFLCTHGVT